MKATRITAAPSKVNIGVSLSLHPMTNKNTPIRVATIAISVFA
ncbi:MAG: hypothetical protein NTY03_00990 [Candidatus Bathyarchaeota archaeon]|nr:hypothetical protein [Candidatus Bathyarchaeota archaeon]